MPAKVSAKFLTTDSRPSLVRYYEEAHLEILGKKIFIHPSKFPIFSTFADDLRPYGIDNRKYAFTVIRILKSWLKTKKLTAVPINVFCGDWAFNRFMKIYESETVEIIEDDPEEAVFQSELLVARYYISQNVSGTFVRLRDAVEELRPLLNKKWLTLYEGKLRPDKFMYKAAEMLAEEFGVRDAMTYNDIIGKLCKS